MACRWSALMRTSVSKSVGIPSGCAFLPKTPGPDFKSRRKGNFQEGRKGNIAMSIPKREITEAEADELETLVDTAKLRALTHAESIRYFPLLGYDQEWAEQLARYEFPLK